MCFAKTKGEVILFPPLPKSKGAPNTEPGAWVDAKNFGGAGAASF